MTNERRVRTPEERRASLDALQRETRPIVIQSMAMMLSRGINDTLPEKIAEGLKIIVDSANSKDIDALKTEFAKGIDLIYIGLIDATFPRSENAAESLKFAGSTLYGLTEELDKQFSLKRKKGTKDIYEALVHVSNSLASAGEQVESRIALHLSMGELERIRPSLQLLIRGKAKPAALQ